MVSYPFQRLITREGEMIQKNKRYHCFQNTSISQRRTSQMIRRSPTAYESRIYVLTITLRKIFLVFQLGDQAVRDDYACSWFNANARYV